MIIIAILAFILILGILVIIHELGHFLLAKLFKVGVEEFGVGFPPRMAGKSYKGTLYSINWIPIGGFVKIKGVVGGDQMDSPVHKGHTQPSGDDFASRPIWQRFSILVGGIVMNTLLAGVLFSIGFMIGMPSSTQGLPSQANIKNPHVLVAGFQDDVPAQQQGLEVGDTILSINQQPITSFQNVKDQFTTIQDQDTVEMTVKKQDNTEKTLSITATQLTPTTVGIGANLAETAIVRLPWYLAIPVGFQQMVSVTINIFIALSQMIVGLFVADTKVAAQVAGPLGIASLTYEATQNGVAYVVQFAALLSINLAIFNLLPFPALDGGRILFLLIELVWRRPLNQKVEAVIHNLGFIILLAMVLLVTIKDIFSFF